MVWVGNSFSWLTYDAQVIQWVAFNCGCKTIRLDDAWERRVHIADDVDERSFRKQYNLSRGTDGNPAITFSEYADVFRYLDRSTPAAELEETAYATGAGPKFDAEFEQAGRDGTVDAAKSVGYYGLFNFADPEVPLAEAGRWLEQDVLEVKGTRMRSTNNAQWATL